jgi:glycosyltransferase involved in cell wall biosynthesis
MSVSICIPTFNNTNYIKECLESIYISGKDLEYEVLVGVDNCQDTLNFIKSIDLNDKTQIFYFKKNVGPYVIKNTLSKIAKYDNLIFFDSDDIMLPNLISETNRVINQFDLVKYKMVNFKIVNGEIIENKKRRAWGEGVFAIKKSLFLNFNGFEGWRVAADSDFMGRMYKNKVRVHVFDEVMFYRRLHPDGLTSNPETGFGSKLRDNYARISRNKRYFGPLNRLVTEEYEIVDFNNFTISENTIEKSEIQEYIEQKKGKSDIVNKIISSQKIEPKNKVKYSVKYEVVNSVTQHRLNQKSQYLNAMMKTNLIPRKHFNQPVDRKRF